MDMELKSNQLVDFGEYGKHGWIEGVQWNDKHNAFRFFTGESDEYGRPVAVYSDKVIEKPARKPRKKTVPSRKSCPVEIFPEYSTEKAYAICAGTDGSVLHPKQYYDFIAKSVCYVDENGRIFAPVWAVKSR